MKSSFSSDFYTLETSHVVKKDLKQLGPEKHLNSIYFKKHYFHFDFKCQCVSESCLN